MKGNYTLIKYFLLGFTISILSCKTIDQRGNDEHAAHIQATLDSLVHVTNIPGINFSYIADENKPRNYSSGYEHISMQARLSPSHVMFSGSVGKTYVAAIIFQLVDEGRIRLEDKILSHLPDEAWLLEIPSIKDITVRMLISHTSGLPRWIMKLDVWEQLNKEPDKIWSYHDRLSFILNEESVHRAGHQWAYSDTNYLLLGYLIESILNEDYYEVLDKRILSPYKLIHTHPSLQRKMEKLAFAYSDMPEPFLIPNEVVNPDGVYVFNPQVEWTGGGLASTTADLAKWAKIYYTSDVISEHQRANMIEIQNTGRAVYEEVHSYGMGTFVYKTKFGVAYGHSGFMPGYNTIMAYFPGLKLSCAIQINCDYASRALKLTEYLEACIEALNMKTDNR